MSRVEFRQVPAGSVRYDAPRSGLWTAPRLVEPPTAPKAPVRPAAEVAAELAAADLAAARRWFFLAVLCGCGALVLPTLLLLF